MSMVREHIRPRVSPLLLFCTAVLTSHPAAAQPPELGQGWLAEFNLAGRQLLELAATTPSEKFAWSPAPGVRSVSEVYMHIALGNYYLLNQAGAKIPDQTPEIAPGLDKRITAKPEVIRWLKNSLDAVREAYPNTDRSRKVKFFGKETTSESVFLRILVHNHEHMGQAVAYARMNGVVPPWSQTAQTTPVPKGDEAAIRAVVREYVDARERRDPQAVRALFTADADQLVSSGEWRKGQEEVVRGTLASSQRTGGTRSITVESVRFLAPDVALADGRYELSGMVGGESRKMWTSLMLTRGPDGWRIAAIRNMLPAPAAASPSTASPK